MEAGAPSNMDLLKDWVDQQTEDFTIDHVREEVLGNPISKLFFSNARISHMLRTLGCAKIEKRDPDARFWYRPPNAPAHPAPDEPVQKHDPANPTQQHLSLLGLSVRDRVTGMEGIVTSISFDLYGCIQALINTGLDEKGEFKPQNWFDIRRMEVLSEDPVMEQPDFVTGAQAEGRQGAADKPLPAHH